MARQKLSKTLILETPLPDVGKRTTLYDTEVVKLAVRITHTGARTFYVVKRTGASMAWVKLGDLTDMTVEKARIEAGKVLGEFASGANPAKARRAIREELTFAKAFDELLTHKRKRNGTPLSEHTKRDYQDVLRLYLAPITGKKLSEISRTDVKAIHRKASKTSAAQADRAVAVVSSVFTFMLDQELFSGTNPASRIQKNLPAERDRFVQADELPALFAAIAQSSQRDYFLLSLLTGARRSNVQAMAWKDVDMDGAVWRIGKTKNGTPQNVTLSPEALAVLRLRAEAGNDSPFVFPGAGETGHLVEPKKAWDTCKRSASFIRMLDALQAAGVLDDEKRAAADELALKNLTKAERTYQAQAKAAKINPDDYTMRDLRIHDLRRTLGSWQAKTGASLSIIGKSLNHKTHQATAIYARLDLDPVRQSVNTATSAMMEAAGLKDSAEVVPIKKGKTAA
jgi:integrase